MSEKVFNAHDKIFVTKGVLRLECQFFLLLSYGFEPLSYEEIPPHRLVLFEKSLKVLLN